MKSFLRNLILLSIICLISVGCDGWGRKDNTPPQTIIVYMAGVDLSGYFRLNRDAIKRALSSDIQGKSRVVVFQQTNKITAELVEIVFKDGICQEIPLAIYDLPSQMNASELGFILSDIIERTPAKAHSLIIGSHGKGWLPIGADPEAKAAYLGTGKVGEEPTHEELWERKGDIVTRYLGEDSNPQNRFDTTDLSEALTSTGVKMEYILFDACFMSNVETMYDLRTNAKYIIGSPHEIMGDGFPYADIIPLLLENNGQSYNLDGVCYKFNEFYSIDVGYSGSIALVDCAQLDGLAQAMKRVNNSTQKDYNIDDIQSYEGQSRHIFFDLGDYVDKMCDNAQAKKEFDEQLARTVISKYTLDGFYSMYGKSGVYDINAFSGVNTSAPSSLYRSAYQQTAWYKATK
ncbi:MAG: hypothetical protein IKV12_00780 [Alistipes sp.]|nr:hypothetical protein [Alistipes sp.]